MIDYFLCLNNFSEGLVEISKNIDEDQSDFLPNDLPFIDLSPLTIPPPPELSEEDELINTKKTVKKDNISDIGKSIIKLQNSIIEKLDIGNGVLKEQKQTLRMLKNQNLLITLPNIETQYENIGNPQNFKYSDPQIQEKKQEFIIEKSIEKIPSLSINLPDLPELMVDVNFNTLTLPEIKDVQLPVNLFGLSEINKVLENIKVEVPINLKGLSDFDFGKIDPLSVPIFYNLKNEMPNLDGYGINIPIDYSQLNRIEIPNFDKINIPIEIESSPKFNVDKIPTLVQTIEYIGKEKIDNNKTIKIDYDTTNNNLLELSPIKIGLEYENNLIPPIDSLNIPVNYLINQRSILPSEEKVDIPLDFKFKNNFKKLFDDKNSNLLNKIAKDVEIDYKFKSNKIIDTETKKIEKFYSNNYSKEYLNEIKYLSEQYVPKLILEKEQNGYNSNEIKIQDSFLENMSNISNYVEGFVEKLESINSLEFMNNYDQFDMNKINNNIESNKLTSNVDVGRIRMVNSVSTPSMMLSTLDPKQFNSLIDTLENNSKIISQNLSKGDQKNEGQIVSPSVMTIQPKKEENKKGDDDLIKIMSSLDEKMTLMISALSNISSWVNENRTTSTSLKPYKH